VCGRTFLVGEQVQSFVSIEGPHEVCELCAGTTAELGWLPADQEGAEEAVRAESERKPGFFARMFARPKGAPEEDYFAEAGFAEPDDVGAMPPPPADATPVANHELDTERYDVEAERADDPSPRERLKGLLTSRGGSADHPAADEVAEPEESTATAPAPRPDPAGRGMRPRRLQPELSPTSRFERAISRFNAGEAGRTVAGLTRTLGAPSVSVGDSAGAEDEVRVTVAWELTWYQWGVDLGDELRPVYELSKGFEVDEIDAAARQWNASAHDGRIVMVAPRRREAVDGRPVHR
jgi:hypothetical protein